MRFFLFISIAFLTFSCQTPVTITSLNLPSSVIYHLNEEVNGHHISRKTDNVEVRLLTKQIPFLENGTVIRQVTSREGEMFTPETVTFKEGKVISFNENKRDLAIKYDREGRLIQSGHHRYEYLSKDSTRIETTHANAMMIRQEDCYIINSKSKGPDFDTKATICFNDKLLRINEKFEYIMDENQRLDGNELDYDHFNRLIENRESNIVNDDTTYLTTFQFEYTEQGLLAKESVRSNRLINPQVFEYSYQVIQVSPYIIRQTQVHQGTTRKELVYHFDEEDRITQVISSKGNKRMYSYQ